MSTIKGHWPRGKRRNPTKGTRLLLSRVKRLLKTRHQPKKVSIRALAKFVGVDAHTATRWLRDEDIPTVASQRRLAKWLEQYE